MLKKNVFIVAILIFSMIAMYGYVPMTNAAGLTSAKDTLSTSAPSATGVTHTIVFRPGVDVTSAADITVTFETGIVLTQATGTCPLGETFASSSNTVTCNVGTTLASTTDYTITVLNASNPTAGDYDVTISHNQGSGESSKIKIYIISQVTVNATVDANLTFAITGVATTTTINGQATTGSSTAVAMNFNTLDYNQAIMGQQLAVTTNADGGFTVTVQQDGNLRTAAGADINSFSTSSVAAWTEPAGTITDDTTWGHMGVVSGDDDISSGELAGDVADGSYVGLDSTNPLEVMRHTGPADGSTLHSGRELVAFSVEISPLQEAGDYSNALTYICTPTF